MQLSLMRLVTPFKTATEKISVRLGNPDLDFENLNPDFPIERTLIV